MQTRAQAILRKANGLRATFYSVLNRKSLPIVKYLAKLEQLFLKHDAQLVATKMNLPGGVYSGMHVSALNLLDNQRSSIRGLIDEIRLRLRDYREEIKFNRTLWASILALALSSISAWLTYGLYQAQVKREDSRDLVQFQRTFDGVIFELAVARDQSIEFIKKKDKSIQEMKSPVWTLKSNAINSLLGSGRIDDKKVYLALFYLADLFSSLNDRNHMMANAAVDLMPIPQRKHFLKENLTAYAEHSQIIVNRIDEAEPALGKFARGKGLSYESIDFKTLKLTQTKEKELAPK